MISLQQNDFESDICISIVNWKTGLLLLDCIQSIYNTIKTHSFQITVVDNASSDGSIHDLATRFPDVNIILNDKNMGFAFAHNQVLSTLNSRYALILNPDCTVENFVVDTIVNYMDCNPKVGIVAPKALKPDSSVISPVIPIPTLLNEVYLTLRTIYPFTNFIKNKKKDEEAFYDSKKPMEVSAVGGPFLLVRTNMFKDIGLMENLFFLFSEEADLCLRASQKGWKRVYFPNQMVYHQVGTCRAKQSPDFSEYHFYRSRLIFFKKHYGTLALNTLSMVYLFFCCWTLTVESGKHLVAFLFKKKRSLLHIQCSKARMKAVFDVLKRQLF